MGKFWMKVWIWTKVIAFACVFIYVLIFVIKNLDNKAAVWYSYNKEVGTSTLVLALFAFIGGVLCTVLVRTTAVTMRQMREIKERNSHEKLHRDVQEIKTKAAMLQSKSPGEKTSET